MPHPGRGLITLTPIAKQVQAPGHVYVETVRIWYIGHSEVDPGHSLNPASSDVFINHFI